MLDHHVLSALLEQYRGARGKPVRTFTLGGRLFDFNRYRYLVASLISPLIRGITKACALPQKRRLPVLRCSTAMAPT